MIDWNSAIWAVVVMASVLLLYDTLRRETAYIGRKDFQRLREDHDSLERENAEDLGDLGKELDALRHEVAGVKLLERTAEVHGSKLDKAELGRLEVVHAAMVQRQDHSALAAHCKVLEETINRERAERDQLAEKVGEHRADFEEICKQWRLKVGELDQKLEQLGRERENLIRDARNTIAGDLAVASEALNAKGWR